MRLLFQEIKKIFLPGRCLITLVALLVLCWNVPRIQNKAMLLLDTKNYPESFTVDDDDYSVHQLFQDHLLEDFGSIITQEDAAELEERIQHLEAQLIEVAAEDPVLDRTGTRYDPQLGHFIAQHGAISDDDQSYLWSYINGQIKPEGMDSPIFFLFGYRGVLETLALQSAYYPLGYFPLLYMSSNLDIPVYFIYAAGFLLLLYGVGESRSGTEELAFSTKTGQRVFSRKIIAAVISGFVIALAGAVLAFILLSRWQLQRYYGSGIDTALFSAKELQQFGYAEVNYGTTYIYTYIVLLCNQLLVSTGYFLLITVISLHTRYHITAIAACLPIQILFFLYDDYYYSITTPSPVPANRYGLLILTACFLAASILITHFLGIRKLKMYHLTNRRKHNV